MWASGIWSEQEEILRKRCHYKDWTGRRSSWLFGTLGTRTGESGGEQSSLGSCCITVDPDFCNHDTSPVSCLTDFFLIKILGIKVAKKSSLNMIYLKEKTIQTRK